LTEESSAGCTLRCLANSATAAAEAATSSSDSGVAW